MQTKHIVISAGILSALVLFIYTRRQRNNPAKVFYVKKLLGNYNAQTIPPFGIFIKEQHKNNSDLLKHELIHWQQFQQEGLLPFVFNYAKAQRKYGYDKNPYELSARINETQYCQQNYTACVRSGQAKTIYNPNFKK